jgi:hypothetical protein
MQAKMGKRRTPFATHPSVLWRGSRVHSHVIVAGNFAKLVLCKWVISLGALGCKGVLGRFGSGFDRCTETCQPFYRTVYECQQKEQRGGMSSEIMINPEEVM